MKKYFFALLITIFYLASAYADAPNGLAFLKISPDVRSAGMGEIGVVTGDERAASHYNPALLGIMDQRGISLAHHQWIQDVGVNYLELHLKSKINVGLNILATGVDDIEIRNSPTPEPVAYVDSRDLALGLNLSYSLSERLHLGLNTKYIHEHIYSQDTDGLAVDLGAFWQATDKIAFGASIANLGAMSKMMDEKPDLPLTGRVGASYLLSTGSMGSVLIAGGATYVQEEDIRGNIGLEWQPMELIAFRGGYLLNYDERSFTAGAGLRWKNLGLDFAYAPFGSDLGDVKRFGFFIDF